MAAKKPLVLTNGEIEQIQSGDTLDAVVVEVDVVEMTATQTFAIGEAAYCDGNDSVDLAKADAVGTTKCIGLAREAITGASSGEIQTDGVLTLTTGQWDAVAGTTGGLTAGQVYWLSEATAGKLKGTAPSTGFISIIGIALSATSLLIKVQKPIKL